MTVQGRVNFDHTHTIRDSAPPEARDDREAETRGYKRKLGGVFGGGVHDVRFVAQ